MSQHRTIILDNIPGNAFPVPEFILAFNRPNYHPVKLHRLPFIRAISDYPPSTNSSEAVTGEVFFAGANHSDPPPTRPHYLRRVRVLEALRSDLGAELIVAGEGTLVEAAFLPSDNGPLMAGLMLGACRGIRSLQPRINNLQTRDGS